MRRIAALALLAAAAVQCPAAEATKGPVVGVYVDPNAPGTVKAVADAIERALSALSKAVLEAEIGRVRFTLGKIAGEELELAAAMEVATWKRDLGQSVSTGTSDHLNAAVTVIRRDLDDLSVMVHDSGRLRDLDPVLVSGLYCFISDGYVRGYGFGADGCGYSTQRQVKFEGSTGDRPGTPDPVAALRAEAAGLQELAKQLGMGIRR